MIYYLYFYGHFLLYFHGEKATFIILVGGYVRLTITSILITLFVSTMDVLSVIRAFITSYLTRGSVDRSLREPLSLLIEVLMVILLLRTYRKPSAKTRLRRIPSSAQSYVTPARSRGRDRSRARSGEN